MFQKKLPFFTRFFIFQRIDDKPLMTLKNKLLVIFGKTFSNWKPLMQEIYRKVFNQFTALSSSISFFINLNP